MKKQIIFATGNQNKMREIREIYGDLDYEILSMKEAGIDVDIVEDGETFEDNALIKASAIAKECDAIVFADDSGLEIDYLNKEPGVYSARYMGEDTSYDIKNANLIGRLEGVPKEQRTARFVCAIAAVFPDGSHKIVRGTIEGYIGYEPAGANGFGYDPIFYVDEYGCSTAELPPEEKNKISHRGKALRMMKEELLKYEDTRN
ncbi:MAG: XTP/dITP diphosphatase [Lachnospiraceae bacterium]|nr:XTP/dITP diphosphatase [Lachnospiraceae bacterium]MDD6193156.1 XTP/dITP diphosphatase [Lachnospiraceae bacterium]MDY4793187.1 XTP/dITP diphosphatase [Pararoseburia sp.]